MMSTTPRPRAAFTLVELLFATVLMVILIVSATTAFVQIRNLTHRIELRQQLHSTARTVAERMGWELSCLMQGAAVFAIGTRHDTTTTPPTPGPVELVFLLGKLDSTDLAAGTQNSLTDQVWSRWYWDSVRLQLMLSASSSALQNNNGPRHLPSPERLVMPLPPTAATGTLRLTTTLTDPAPYGIGDYQDLLNNQGVIAANCSAFAIEVVCQDGTVRRIVSTTGADTEYLCHGQPVDGRGVASSTWTAATGTVAVPSPLSSRPRLIRICFTLTEPAGKLTTSSDAEAARLANGIKETFSFSFLVPALSPGP